MSNDYNIEELFRSTFETFEAPVDPSVWTAVQSGVVAKGAGTVVAVKAGAGIVKTLLISGATLAGGLALGYVFFGGDAENNTRKNDNNATETSSLQTEENTTYTGENTSVANDNMVDVVIPIEDKSTGKKEIVKIQIPESQYTQSSIVEDQLSQADKKAWDKWREQMDKEKSTTSTAPIDKTEKKEVRDVNTFTEEVAEDMPVASIVANKESGMAPFLIKLSNATNEMAYAWEFGDGSVSTEENPEHIYREPGTYTIKLTVKNKSGKSVVAKKTIEVFETSEITIVPNIVTPNNDGVNDEYRVEGKNIKRFTMWIYNKTGEQVFYSTDMEQGWNGELSNGNAAPAGRYIVVVVAVGSDNNPIERKGWFELKR